MESEAILAVIVPVYNAEQYLEKCVNSIICQTFKQLEIILVDDGSTDRSFCICEKMAAKDARIKVFRKENSGPLSAKKMGMENTSASYVMFVDADDWIDSQMCEKMFETMKYYHVDIVTSGIIRYFSDSERIYDVDNFQEGRYGGEAYREQIIPHMLCDGGFLRRGLDASLAIKLFRYDILYPVIAAADEKYGFLFGEDTAVVYPYMLKASSVYIMKNCFYYHRQYKNHQAVYFEDKQFGYKVRRLYLYLKEIFTQDEAHAVLLRQLDYFTYGLIRTKYESHARRIVKQTPNLQQYLFPFHRVKKGSRVLLYGAGDVGKSFYAQLVKTNYCKEIFWQDRQYEICQKEKLPVGEVCLNIAVDVCVIAVQSEKLSCEIRKALSGQGLESEKIIWEDPVLKMW